MKTQHTYQLTINWTGNKGVGTRSYGSYERSHSIKIDGKTDILGSADPAFRGDATKHNPEDLFLASLASCHMLWYLSLCALSGVVVLEYSDNATGIMMETEDGGGHFTEVTLNPKVKVSEASMLEKARELHQEANKKCFIANSCNFPVYHQAICEI